MATYSLAATGTSADQTFAVSTVQVSDVAGLLGSQQLAMKNNTVLLCKGPDGGFRNYTIDAERSTPSKVVLKAV